MCPELPQQPVEGGISLPGFPKPSIEPGEASRAAGDLGVETGRMITEMAVHVNDIKAQVQGNAANSEYVNRMTDTAQTILDDPKFRTNFDLKDPNSAPNEFNRRMAPVRAEILEKYPMGNRYGALARNMDIDFAHSSRLIQHRAFINDQEDTEASVVGQKFGAVANATNPLLDGPAQARFYHDYISGVIKPAVDSGLMLPGKGAALHV